MINDLGKFLRTIRIEKDERLLDMSRKIGVSVAFLSAIETGRKDPPLNIVERIASAYKMKPKQRVQLELAVSNSRTTFRLEAQSPAAQDTAALLARRLNRLSAEEHRKIQAILGREGEK
jgi:HTH-type transcriptional regulator, competence development regulator